MYFISFTFSLRPRLRPPQSQSEQSYLVRLVDEMKIGIGFIYLIIILIIFFVLGSFFTAEKRGKGELPQRVFLCLLPICWEACCCNALHFVDIKKRLPKPEAAFKKIFPELFYFSLHRISLSVCSTTTAAGSGFKQLEFGWLFCYIPRLIFLVYIGSLPHRI